MCRNRIANAANVIIIPQGHGVLAFPSLLWSQQSPGETQLVQFSCLCIEPSVAENMLCTDHSKKRKAVKISLNNLRKTYEKTCLRTRLAYVSIVSSVSSSSLCASEDMVTGGHYWTETFKSWICLPEKCWSCSLIRNVVLASNLFNIFAKHCNWHRLHSVVKSLLFSKYIYRKKKQLGMNVLIHLDIVFLSVLIDTLYKR